MDFGSSRDLLYVVLSICIVWFTVFLCWLLYEAGRMLRNANRIIENVTDKLELISEAVEFIRHKTEGLATSMGTVTGMLSTLAEKLIMQGITRWTDKNATAAAKKRASRKSSGE